MTAKVELVAHDPSWSKLAAAEGNRLKATLGDNLYDVQHIGSTSVTWIKARPTIDLMPRVQNLAALDAKSEEIKALGYDWRGEEGFAGRRYFTRDDPNTGRRLFNVHAYQYDSRQIERHLAFRDYLNSHPDEARAYEAAKERAAALYPDDMLQYDQAKSAWIRAHEQIAWNWWFT